MLNAVTRVLGGADSHEQGTRDRVLREIGEHGPITAAELASRLGLTPTAVRRHLDALLEATAISPHEHAPTGRRGRPARAWVLAPAGHTGLPSDYADLAGEAVRFLAEVGGEEAVSRFARSRFAELEEGWAAELADAEDPAGRTAALVAALSRDGFAATARPVGSGAAQGIQVCQGHCPVQRVAAEFPQLCEAEREAFSRLLGVHVQRLATLAHGDHVCTTFVPVPPIPEKEGSAT